MQIYLIPCMVLACKCFFLNQWIIDCLIIHFDSSCILQIINRASGTSKPGCNSICSGYQIMILLVGPFSWIIACRCMRPISFSYSRRQILLYLRIPSSVVSENKKYAVTVPKPILFSNQHRQWTWGHVIVESLFSPHLRWLLQHYRTVHTDWTLKMVL